MAKKQPQKGVIDIIADSCQSLGEVDLAGIALETADPRLLDVSQMDLDRHVSMQPAAMAYYGSLLKDASRRLAAYKRSYDRWEKKKYAEAKASLASGTGKSTVADIEARFIVDNEAEIEKREKQLERLQYEYDTMNVWFEAWRQKSFSISQHAGITEDERWNERASLRGDEKNSERRDGLSRVKSIIKNRQEA
jgi:hypothetical protein